MKLFKVGINIILFILIASNILAQSTEMDGAPQYLFNSFTSGNVLFKTSKMGEAVMNYNMVTEKIVFEQDGQLLDMINIHTIDTIYLQDCKFIPVGEVFYEVIATTSPLPLFIQHQGKLLPPDNTVAYGGSSLLSPPTRIANLQYPGGYYNYLQLSYDYKVEINPVYWLMKDNEMINFSNVKELRKLFPEKEEEIKTYIKKNRFKLEKKDDLIKIVKFIDEMYNGYINI